MTPYLAMGIAGGFKEEDASGERQIEAWQLQGWFGRQIIHG